MLDKLLANGKKIFYSSQDTVLSAASVIMMMVMASRVLGLVRQRILANFFPPAQLSLFFAAFRLPDLIFEVLVFGTFSSAFIPVFARALKKGKKEAWDIAGRVLNIGLILFIPFALIVSIWTKQIYGLMLPGFSNEEVIVVSSIARILILAQALFVMSYVFTAVLESLRHFLIPALAPIFYNLGIIIGTIFLTPSLGITAPAVGVVLGALGHFLVQFPLSYKLGFRFSKKLKPNEEVKKIGKLAIPRVIDVSVEQIQKTIELSLATLISTASYTYYTFANTLQVLPVSLFGTSLAKASLPVLSSQADNPPLFRKTLLSTIYQVVFLTIPIASLLIVLRIPIVRLIYGTNIFDWQATVQTGLVLSAFAIGIPFQSMVTIFSRAFFALHDTKTPVLISLTGMTLAVLGDIIGVKFFGLPVWILALSFSIGMIIESIILSILLHKKISGIYSKETIIRFFKPLVASILSGFLMFIILKFFDRSVWVKRLSFITNIQALRNIQFEKFVLDTRYTVNLLVLTAIVALVGVISYVLISLILQSEELKTFLELIKRVIIKPKTLAIAEKEEESVVPTSSDSTPS
jgi:putative peptidoglycan lipid II flippase